MKLQYLILSNIGPFRGRHTVDLNSDNESTGYAFFAENGRGKTSIYNAMRWCLFGEVSERAKTVGGNTISGSVRPIVGDGKILMNDEAYENDDPQEMSVMLIAEGEKGKITVQRTATSTTKLARSDDDLKIDLQVSIGSAPMKSGSEGQEAIESFFPQELERFFFIDGEALEEYTEMMQSSAAKGLQDEVNAILGIPGLLRGSDDLSKIRQQVKSRIVSNTKAQKSSTANNDKYIAQQNKYSRALKQVNEKEKLLKVVVDKLESTKEEMAKHKELQPLIEEIKTVDLNLQIKQQRLAELAREKVSESTVAWKVLIWQRAEQIHKEVEDSQKKQLERERSISQTQESISDLQKMIDDFTGFCNECNQALPDHEAYKAKLQADLDAKKTILKRLESSAEQSNSELIIKLGDLEKLRPRDDSKDRINSVNEKWRKVKSDIENLIERKAVLNSKVTEEAKSDFGEIAALKGKQETIVASREKELKQARNQLNIEELELKRLQKLSGAVTQDTEALKVDDVIGKLMVTIKDTIASYRERARKEVEEQATKVFLNLSNAPEVHTGISVDKEFKTKIKNSRGGYERSPSSGMVSMMTLSVIDALRRVSGIDAPVFLDTPGRSLDEKHKGELLNYFWQSKGHQFLIFAHSGEYTVDETVKQYKNQLAKAWTVSFPKDHKEICFKAGCKSTKVEHDAYNKTNNCKDCGNTWNIGDKRAMILEVDLT